MDMLGAGNGLYVAGGENFPEIRAAMEGLATASPRLRPQVGEDPRGGRADHAPFFEKGIHAVSLFAMGGDHHGYHSPDDTVYFVTPKTMESGARTVFGRRSPWPTRNRSGPRASARPLKRQEAPATPGPLASRGPGPGYFPGDPEPAAAEVVGEREGEEDQDEEERDPDDDLVQARRVPDVHEEEDDERRLRHGDRHGDGVVDRVGDLPGEVIGDVHVRGPHGQERQRHER
jgi:hypothetical protein